MKRQVYDLQGYSLVLDHVLFVTRVFEAGDDEGFQFNVMLSGETRIAAKFPVRTEATLARELLVKALRDGPAS